MPPKDINEIFRRFSEANPTPETELRYTNHYTLLVAVILSAQATDVSVNKATFALFKVADTPEKMVKLGEEKLKGYIKTIGLFNMKAKNVIAMSQALIKQHQSAVPNTREALEKLPGVGKKTAAVVMNCAFGEPTIAVDTHVFRVSNRLGLVKTQTPEKTEAALLKVIPKKWQQHAHHWLILHGRYICKAAKPRCPDCLVRDLCPYPHKTEQN
ncbi:MAG: endonuclease III [Proteobacteria bacterium]|nr:endonuclease III [Pseudomonadota bacterium]